MINFVFNNPLLYVIDYPGDDTVEILDKRSGRMGIVRGHLAKRFRHDFGILVSQSGDEDSFADFIDNYDGIMNQSTRLH